MKNILSSISLFFIALLVFSTSVWAHTDVSVSQALDMVNTNPQLIVVDVREEGSEYCGPLGHIPAALNYPWSSGVLEDRYDELPIDGEILVVCHSGGRSNSAANFLDAQGFTSIYDMNGRKINTLSQGQEQAGYHNVVWRGVDQNGNLVPSGLYFCRMKGEGIQRVIRMLLMK